MKLEATLLILKLVVLGKRLKPQPVSWNGELLVKETARLPPVKTEVALAGDEAIETGAEEAVVPVDVDPLVPLPVEEVGEFKTCW